MELSQNGYVTCVFNLMFLLQQKIFKQISGQSKMDEGLFRDYFIKIYKSLGIMESEYLKILSSRERRGFCTFTKAVKDLALFFRCHKDHGALMKDQDDEYERKPTKK
jgi:hypothetical protein